MFYVLFLLPRAVCVVFAPILFPPRPPLLWLWVTLCLAGAVFLPWAAVLLANDKGPRPEHRLRNKFNRQPTSHPDPDRALHDREHKVIDLE